MGCEFKSLSFQTPPSKSVSGQNLCKSNCELQEWLNKSQKIKSSGIKGASNGGREYFQGSVQWRRKLLKGQSKSQKWMKKPEKLIKRKKRKEGIQGK